MENSNANKAVSSNEVNNNNIIDVILAKQAKTKEEVNAQADSNKTLIDNKTFFTDNFPEGILSKEQFLQMITRPSKAQLSAINSLARAMTEKRKINTSDFSYTDKKGHDYYFIKLDGQNGGTEFKILTFPGLDKLIKGYLWNVYNVQISLEGLYQEVTTA
jgi:hypothetical protein